MVQSVLLSRVLINEAESLIVNKELPLLSGMQGNYATDEKECLVFWKNMGILRMF